MVSDTVAKGINEKLSSPAVLWVMLELCILRVHVIGVINVAIQEVLPKLLCDNIKEGLETGVDFLSLTKVCVCEKECI